MVASRDLRGVPVVDYRRGHLLGRAETVCYCPGARAIHGLVYQKAGLLNRTEYIPLPGLHSLSASVVLAEPAAPKTREARPSGYPQSIFLSDGRYLGELFALMLEETGGTVRAVLISTSLVDDMRRGLIWLEQPQRLAARINHILLLDQT